MRHTILGLLSSGSKHGYDLRAAFERDILPHGKLNIGQVYTTLERLERDGQVRHEVVRQAERPDKKVFTLTDSGREELARWLGNPSDLALDLRNEVFLKIAVARRMKRAGSSDADPLQIIGVQRRTLFERLHEVTQARARAKETSVEEAMLLDLAVLRLEAFLKWLDRCEETLSGESES